MPLWVGDPVQCKAVSDYLLDQRSIYVQPINYPTVPKGTERLRLTPTPLHADEDMDALIAALNDAWKAIGVRRTPAVSTAKEAAVLP